VFLTLWDNERLLIEAETHLRVDNLNDLTTEPEYTMPISLERTLFWLREFDKIMTRNIDIFDTNIVTGIPLSINEDKVDNFIEAKDTIDNISGHLGGIDLNTLATALNNEGKTLRDAFQEIGQLNQAVKTVLGVNVLPTDYPNQLNLLKTNSDHYNRIHTKLGGKVSDTELDTLLNTPPPQCSHTDYDTIKSERDTLKTENAELKDKEKTILEKLITDCNLGIDKNSTLDQVITKIKGLSPTSPTENSAKITELEQQKSQLETQLKDKETKITELQSQKPTEEIKSEIIESSKKLGLFSSEFQQKLSKVNSYQELAQLQQEAFKEKLLEKESSLQRIESNTKQLKIGLVFLVIVLVSGIIGYFVKQAREKYRRKEIS